MKKLIAIFLCCFLLASCGAVSAPPSNENSVSSSVSSQSQKIEVDEKLLTVEISLPKSFVDWMASTSQVTPEELVAKMIEDDGQAVLNEDGSITLTMKKSDYNKAIEEMKASISDSVKTAPENFKSIKKIEYNQNISEFKVFVDKEAFNSGLDRLAFLGIYMQASVFRYFDGDDSGTVTFILIDDSTGEQFDEIIYPEAMTK